MKALKFFVLTIMVAFVSVAYAQTRTALIKIDDLSLLMPENDMKALKKYDYIIPIEMSIDVDDYEECTMYTDGCGKWIIHADNRLILFSKEGVICDNLKIVPPLFEETSNAYYAFAFAIEMCDCYVFVGINEPKSNHQKKKSDCKI